MSRAHDVSVPALPLANCGVAAAAIARHAPVAGTPPSVATASVPAVDLSLAAPSSRARFARPERRGFTVVARFHCCGESDKLSMAAVGCVSLVAVWMELLLGTGRITVFVTFQQRNRFSPPCFQHRFFRFFCTKIALLCVRCAFVARSLGVPS